jgi:hypothetical protein
MVQYVLFASILSQNFTIRDGLQICGWQNFASALETGDIRFSTNSLDMIKIGVRLQLGNNKPCKVIF